MPKKQQLWIAIIMLWALVLAAHAQAGSGATPIVVSPEEASEHLIRQIPPAYPNIARVAHVEGEVLLEATVSKEGMPGNLKLVSGPPMLVQASMEAVRQWQYEPFLRDQQPVEVIFKITVRFSLTSGEDPQSANFSRWRDKCKALIAAGDYQAAGVVCITTVDMAEKLPQDNQSDRAEAYGYEAQALCLQKEFPASLDYSRRELEFAQKVTDNDFQLGQAYYHTARAFEGIGDLKQARIHYERAAQALKRSHKSTSKDVYEQTMQSFLRDYAVLLRQIGDTSSAERAERQAGIASR